MGPARALAGDKVGETDGSPLANRDKRTVGGAAADGLLALASGGGCKRVRTSAEAADDMDMRLHVPAPPVALLEPRIVPAVGPALPPALQEQLRELD